MRGFECQIGVCILPDSFSKVTGTGYRKVALGTGLDKVPGRGFRETIPQHDAAFLQPPLRNQQHLHSMASIWKTSRSWFNCFHLGSLSRCKETINSQVHCCHASKLVGAHTPRRKTLNLDLSVFDIFVRLYLSRSSHIHWISASIIMNRRNAGTVLNLWSVGVTELSWLLVFHSRRLICIIESPSAGDQCLRRKLKAKASHQEKAICVYIYIYCMNILGKVALAMSVTAVLCNILQLHIWCVQPFTTCPFLRLEYKWWQGPRRLEDQSWVKRLYKL